MPTLIPEVIETQTIPERPAEPITRAMARCSHGDHEYNPRECPSCHVTECSCSVSISCATCRASTCTGCMRMVGDYYYCVSCAREASLRVEPLSGFTKYPGTIEGHSWEPRNHIWKKYRLKHESADYLGVELEVGAGSNTAIHAGLSAAARLLPNLFCAKSDSSITSSGVPYGVEYAFTPMTLGAWKQRGDNVRKWLKTLIDSGNRSHNTRTCGLHVHTTRHRQAESETERNAIACAMVGGRAPFSHLSRRDENSIKSWACFTDSAWANDWTSRGALHFTSRTLEIRLFRGTLEIDSFWTALEFADALRKYARSEGKYAVRKMQKRYESRGKCPSYGRFLAFVQQARIYPHLVDAMTELFSATGRLRSLPRLENYIGRIATIEGAMLAPIMSSPQSADMVVGISNHRLELRRSIERWHALGNVGTAIASAALREVDRLYRAATAGQIPPSEFFHWTRDALIREFMPTPVPPTNQPVSADDNVAF